MSVNEHCQHCPVDPDKTCLGVEAPERFGHFCTLARNSAPMERQMIVGRSAIGLAPEGPGLLRRAVNFAGAVVTHFAAGFPTATPEQQAARLAICRTNECGFYAEGDRCLHSACGCYLQVKVGMADQGCPIGLWGAVINAPAEA